MFSKVSLLAFIFCFSAGMKLILADGNYIEVDRYRVNGEKVVFEKSKKSYVLPKSMVDLFSTGRLADIEARRVTFFKSYTSHTLRNPRGADEPVRGMLPLFPRADQKDPFTVKVESHNPDPPFRQEMLPANRDDNVGNKAENKGFMIKFELPLEK